jgi:cyclase
MKPLRILARCDIKGKKLIKGLRFEGVRVIGHPWEFASRYYERGVDEIVYIDSVASLYQRNSLFELAKLSTKNIFVPISIGGGIRNINDARNVLNSGAEKVIVNTSAIENPSLISDLSKEFGRQCVVLSVQAKKRGNFWEAFTYYGRDPSGLDVIEWLKRAEDLGIGEAFVSSIDQDGSLLGPDFALAEAASSSVQIPVIISGGIATLDDIFKLATNSKVSGVAIGLALHKEKLDLKDIKSYLANRGVKVRV